MIRKNIVLTLLVVAALGSLIWQKSPAVWSAMQVVGVFLFVSGFVLWSTARFQLGASFAVTAQARKLVTRGLYSKIRNPIYVFGSCAIAGLILILGRRVWLLVFVVVIPLQL